MSEKHYEVSLTLDVDGFISRECPYCRMRFKVYKNDLESRLSVVEEIYCPYCGQTAGANEFWTTEQVEYLSKYIANKTIGPRIYELQRALKKMETSSDMLKVKVDLQSDIAKVPTSPDEVNDMEKCELPCCNVTIKVEKKRHDRIRCLFCGRLQE